MYSWCLDWKLEFESTYVPTTSVAYAQVDNSAADASAVQKLIEDKDDEVSFGFDMLLGRFKPSK